MPLPEHIVIRLAVAIGIGLLIGIERERSKGSGENREVAGVRTFTLTALAGAVSLLIGDIAAFITCALIVGLLIAIGYRRSRNRDPGLTSEIAQLVTFLLGGFAIREPQLAAALGVVVAILLVARPALHTWVCELASPLLGAGLMAALYAAAFTIRSARETGHREAAAGRPFDPRTALLFVVVVGIALTVSALLTQWLGSRGLLIACAVGGFGDAHSSAISAATLAAKGSVDFGLARVAVLVGFTTNALSKTVVASTVGDRRYALELGPGILLSVAAGWAGLLVTDLLP